MEEMRNSLYGKANQTYMKSRQGQNPITYEQLQDIKEQIDFDISWNIFDEVNQYNDTEKVLDLNCLDPLDAQQILKTKIFENALVIYNKFNEKRIKRNLSHVILIVCGKNHYTSQLGSKLQRNQILNFI